MPPKFLTASFAIDINLYTSRGDGNSYTHHPQMLLIPDINLYTSRGDGNVPLKRAIPATVTDINLYTSRGDGNTIFNIVYCFR